ncbi:hypothetical protein F2Q69_00036940 [Brassica cretica]|uniref:Uncharacterized protein n=1 Tax=Brassica cretica TaxID=69181 RepID=A0A8S9SLA1_BRACR|nr:hypothetical protein F2Q69_00036940 [Brassica cretica]
MENSSAKSYYDFALNMPDDAHSLINREALHEHLRGKIFFYQSIILSSYGTHNRLISPMGIHLDYPFAHLYRIENAFMPEEVLCFLWKSAKATGLSFKKLKGQGYLNPFFNPHTIYFFHRPVQVNKKTGKILALPTLIHHNDYQRGVRPDFNLNDSKAYEDFQTHVFRLNSATQKFPIPFIPNWFYYPIDYQMSLDEDLQFYLDKRANPPIVQDIPKKEKRNFESQECPPEYFQDAQLPDDSMNIDEVGRVGSLIQLHA